MALLQHRKLRTTIQEAAATGGKSNVHSTHPIPALAYGAEFGLNSTQSTKPGLEHLKNVKPFHY